MNIFLLSLIGAVIILDKYAFGEFGFSQPIISGTIIGAIFGDIGFGIFLGAILQLIFLGGLPIGKDIPPDGQSAGVIGSTTYFLLQKTNPFEQTLFLAIFFALTGALIGGTLEIFTRRFNERLHRLFIQSEGLIYVCHLAGLITALLRSFCLLLPFFLLAKLIVIPEFFPELTKELLLIIAISLGLANGFYLFIKKKTLIYLICGALCGLAFIVF